MKTLFAVRHAKSSWDDSSISDHDRPLNRRGSSDCATMGRALRERSVHPDVILSSTAVRARSTARSIAEALDFPREKIVEDRDWYLAPAEKWRQAVQGIDEKAETAMIFGHNPGMHEFAERMLVNHPIDAFPTLAVAHLEIDVEFWGEADWATARLVEFLIPKAL